MSETPPEADAVDQQAPVTAEPRTPATEPPPVPVEADDADAWEQATEVPEDDEEWR